MNENRQRTRLEYYHHPKATRLTLARPGDPMFDNAAAKLGAYQSPFRFPNGPAKRGVGDPCLPRKPGEGLVLEYSYRPLSITLSIIVSALSRRALQPGSCPLLRTGRPVEILAAKLLPTAL